MNGILQILFLEIKIYFGETLDENGEPLKDIENIFVSSPAIYDKKEELSAMYPNDARLKNLTYKSNVFINVGIQYILHNQDKYIIKNIEKVNIGSIPIMIHSKLCLLHNLDPIKLSDLGECPYDHGGYFIIKGKERVLVSQERINYNIIYVFPRKAQSKFKYIGFISKKQK